MLAFTALISLTSLFLPSLVMAQDNPAPFNISLTQLQENRNDPAKRVTFRNFKCEGPDAASYKADVVLGLGPLRPIPGGKWQSGDYLGEVSYENKAMATICDPTFEVDLGDGNIRQCSIGMKTPTLTKHQVFLFRRGSDYLSRCYKADSGDEIYVTCGKEGDVNNPLANCQWVA